MAPADAGSGWPTHYDKMIANISLSEIGTGTCASTPNYQPNCSIHTCSSPGRHEQSQGHPARSTWGYPQGTQHLQTDIQYMNVTWNILMCLRVSVSKGTLHQSTSRNILQTTSWSRDSPPSLKSKNWDWMVQQTKAVAGQHNTDNVIASVSL